MTKPTTLFPLEKAPPDVRKSIRFSYEDKTDMKRTGGGIKLERFLYLYGGKRNSTAPNFLQRTRGLYLLSANVDLEHGGQRGQKVFKFGIAGTKSGTSENRLSSYLHYYGLNNRKRPHKGVMIFMFLTTRYTKYVHHTNSLIHKLERDMKRELRPQIEDLNKKDKRGDERLLASIPTIKRVIESATRNKMKELRDEVLLSNRQTRSRTTIEKELGMELTEDGRLDLTKINAVKTIKTFKFVAGGQTLSIRPNTILKFKFNGDKNKEIEAKSTARRRKKTYLLNYYDLSNPKIFRPAYI